MHTSSNENSNRPCLSPAAEQAWQIHGPNTCTCTGILEKNGRWFHKNPPLLPFLLEHACRSPEAEPAFSCPQPGHAYWLLHYTTRHSPTHGRRLILFEALITQHVPGLGTSGHGDSECLRAAKTRLLTNACGF